MTSAGWGNGRPAPFASSAAANRGRWHAEPPPRRRTAFQRDRDRIVHATAFRRLNGKTQVFLTDEGDHYRTRLTHTLEVAQIARSLAYALGLDGDLTEAIALAHDLGHPPFGHAGERALDAVMRGHGGFDHNVQSLRVVTLLERRYPDFDGLNLSWEVIEGLAKHNGPVADRDGAALPGKPPLGAILALSAERDLMLWSHPSAEAQCAAIADDIAYNAHDIDDGLRAGLLTLDALREVPLVSDLLAAIADEYPRLERSRLVPELIRRLIGVLIEDVVDEAVRRIAEAKPETPDAVRTLDRPVIAFSPRIASAEAAIKAHLNRAVYRHPSVAGVMTAAEEAVARLHARYADDPGALPPAWRAGWEEMSADRRARRIADFLAGMTDRFALAEHQRLFDRVPDFG
ncbi:MAG: deoxyguanosinetriphosphate triphosphohydrolase [Bauldia sp.]|nr:deoxyguanosinetriphosphate triphosphohydrolase [Bauldia sp.]